MRSVAMSCSEYSISHLFCSLCKCKICIIYFYSVCPVTLRLAELNIHVPFAINFSVNFGYPMHHVGFSFPSNHWSYCIHENSWNPRCTINTYNNKCWLPTIYGYLIIGFEKGMLIINGMNTSIFLSLLEKLDWYCVSKMFYRYSHPFSSFTFHSLYFFRKKSTKEICIVLEDITFRFEK